MDDPRRPLTPTEVLGAILIAVLFFAFIFGAFDGCGDEEQDPPPRFQQITLPAQAAPL